MSEPFLVSGLEIIYDDDEYSAFEIVNPKAFLGRRTCGREAFLDLERQEIIAQWAEDYCSKNAVKTQ
jgi:hypothetical protein